MLSRDTELAIGHALGTRITDSAPVSGGDINQAFRVRTRDGQYFVKLQSKPEGADMFAAEQTGLTELAACGAIAVPKTLAAGSANSGAAFLVMTWHESVPMTHEASRKLGFSLAEMHHCTENSFGFEEDNFIGSLPQPNVKCESWSDFYSDMRIEPMLKLCRHELDAQDERAWDSIRPRLPSLLSCEKASLLHGDLWGGNAMNTPDGPIIYDPAVYYGDRMIDIAMTELFGGFGKVFYASYQEAYPITADERARIELYQLYYLLVHLALFGRSYLAPVRRILNKYAE